MGMPSEKKKVENAAEKTGEAVGKGIKRGAKAVDDFGKGIKKELKKKNNETKFSFLQNKKEKYLFIIYVNSQSSIDLGGWRRVSNYSGGRKKHSPLRRELFARDESLSWLYLKLT